MGRQTPVDMVIKKLRKKLGPDPLLCNEEHRIQVTDEENGCLFVSVEHDLEPNCTWLGLYSEELEMDFDVKIDERSGKILKDKKIKAVNEMIKFTGVDVFVETLAEKILAFNEDAAIYGDRTQITGEEEVITDENRRQVMFKAMAPKNTYFLDRKKGKEIQNREFMSRNFLIEDAKDDSKWKITPFQEDIKGYICQEATMTTEDSTEVKAWFTTQIPIPLGPQGYNSLPGMILKVDINDGDMIIEAKNIQLGELNEDWITAPKKGKKVTQEEFKAIVKEKMEEMREMYGGSGRGPHIRVQTR